MYSAEGIGKTIEKAIENALFELKASRDDVDIKVINEGGLFKKAKVIVTISEDAREKYQKKPAKSDNIETKEFVVDERKFFDEQKENDKNEKTEKPKKEKPQQSDVALVQEDSSKSAAKSRIDKEVDPYEFLKGFFEAAGKTVTINVTEDDKYIHYSVEGEDLGDLIGRRGDAFFAISRLLTIVCGKTEKKLLLDIGGFKEKRVTTLTELAKRTAEKVAKSGRYMKLAPMNASDRRIIHTALQDDERVTTLSKGNEPQRYVIVFPKHEDWNISKK